ncbi:polysaccharide biosynthesis/export family protein [Paraburkholderia fungorum]
MFKKPRVLPHVRLSRLISSRFATRARIVLAVMLCPIAPLSYAQTAATGIPALPPLPPSMQSSDVSSAGGVSALPSIARDARASGSQSLGDVGVVNLNDPSGNNANPADPSAAATNVHRMDCVNGATDGCRPASAPSAQPSPPTEFENFVTQNTGKRLPLFGYNLFSRSGGAYGAVENMPAPADYTIGPGDEILMHAWGGVEGDLHLVVDRNGQVAIPKVGTVVVAGVRASDLDSVLKKQIGRYYTNFSVNATLGRLRSIQVYVVGQAMAPGAYTISSLSTLVSALFSTGGPAPTGSMRAIQLRRGGAVIATVDMYAFITQGSAAGDVHLLPGDVIVIPPAGPRVAVMGALDSPAIYELRGQEESLRGLLGYAGGTTALTTPDKVQIERVNRDNPSAPRSVEERKLDEQGLASTVKDGDIVTLFGTSPAFANAVTLRGNVAAPLRYPYKPNMTLADLIPDPEALLTPDYFLRKNVLVQFDGQRRADANQVAGDVKNLIDEPNWNYAVIERFDRATLSERLIPFNLGDVVLRKDPRANIALQPGDVVTIFGKKDLRNPLATSSRLVRVDGEVRAPGVYQLHAGESLQQVLQRAGGVTPQGYLFGTFFTREATRRQQQQNLTAALDRAEQQSSSQLSAAIANLPNSSDNSLLQTQIVNAQRAQIARLRSLKPTGRVSLELDTRASRISDLPDLPLEDGDAIYVPPVPAFVTAIGAVDNENALIWKPHRTVDDALKIAGVEQDAADMRSAFVLRADGSVISSGGTGWLSSFGSIDLMPGDAVVVPEKLDRRSPMTKFVAGLKDWSQVLANFGLGAAAIQVLK